MNSRPRDAIDGTIGVRAVKTKQDISGTAFTVPTVVPVETPTPIRTGCQREHQGRVRASGSSPGGGADPHSPDLRTANPSLSLDGPPGAILPAQLRSHRERGNPDLQR